METPLSPLEFARRTRALYPEREAVVDGALRLTYGQFFDRCDRWSSALQQLGVAAGEFVYIINHSGAKVVCAHEDYLECLDAVKPQLRGVAHYVALEGAHDGW